MMGTDASNQTDIGAEPRRGAVKRRAGGGEKRHALPGRQAALLSTATHSAIGWAAASQARPKLLLLARSPGGKK